MGQKLKSEMMNVCQSQMFFGEKNQKYTFEALG